MIEKKLGEVIWDKICLGEINTLNEKEKEREVERKSYSEREWERETEREREREREREVRNIGREQEWYLSIVAKEHSLPNNIT